MHFCRSILLLAAWTSWNRILLVCCGIMFSAGSALAVDQVSVEELNRILRTRDPAPPRKVAVRGVVNHRVPRLQIFCIQQGASGVVVKTAAGTDVPSLGAEVEVDTQAGFVSEHPDTVVTAAAVRVLGNPGQPAPVAGNFADAISGKYNRLAVQVEATVVSATAKNDIWYLFLWDGTTAANGLIHTAPADWRPDSLIGSRVRFRGMCGGAGLTALRCSSPDEVQVLSSADLASGGVVMSAQLLQENGLAEAKKARPVKIRGVCTYPNTKGIHFYLHDGAASVVVNLSDPGLCPAFGDEVEVSGISSGYQEVIGINAVSVHKLGRGRLPEPKRVSVGAHGYAMYSQWVEIEGVVLQARGNAAGAVHSMIGSDDAWCMVGVVRPDGIPLEEWDGARVRIRGVNAGYPRLSLFCADASLVSILAPGRKSPFAAPKASAAELLANAKPTSDRVRLEGVVLDVRDSWIYLRNGKQAFRADLLAEIPLDANWTRRVTEEVPRLVPKLGQLVEVVGSPMIAGDYLALRFAQARVIKDGEKPEPRLVDLQKASRGVAANDLVTVRGRLKDYFSGDYASNAGSNHWREVLRLERDGSELEVAFETSGSRGAFASFKRDDEIEATGILRPEEGTPPYRLNVDSLSHVRSLGLAPEVARERHFRLLAVIAAVVMGAGAWIVMLRTKLKRERILAAERMRADAAVRALNTTLESRVGERTAELERAQEELRWALANEREVGELKSRFVSLVSHEFRTPLGITMSAVELLRGYMDRLPEEQRTELLDDIYGATLRMSGMMEQVLLLGRVEAGRMSFQPAPIEITELGSKLVDELRSASSGKCQVRFTAENDVQGAAGDGGLLRHILTNLISNAIKYSPKDGSVEFGVRRDGKEAVFTIRDHGIGIPDGEQGRLFEAFYRAHNVGETPGTGLGLLIVKRCVELHRGSISFESKEGQGTTFTVRLPLFDEDLIA